MKNKLFREGQEINDFVLISKENYQKWLNVKTHLSNAGKKGWSKLSQKERSEIAKKRGKAGSLKRWAKNKK